MIFYPGPSRLPDSPEGMHAWHSREGVVDGRKGGGRDTHTRTQTHTRWMTNAKKKKEQIKQKIQLPVRESRWTIRVIYTQTRFLLTQSKADHVDLYSLFLCFTRDVILKRAKQTSSLKCMQHYLNSFYLSWQLCNQKLQKLYPVLHVLFWFFWLRCHV